MCSAASCLQAVVKIIDRCYPKLEHFCLLWDIGMSNSTLFVGGQHCSDQSVNFLCIYNHGSTNAFYDGKMFSVLQRKD